MLPGIQHVNWIKIGEKNGTYESSLSYDYLINPHKLLAHHINLNTCVLFLLREDTVRINTERLLPSHVHVHTCSYTMCENAPEE